MGKNLVPQVKRSRRLGEAISEKSLKYLTRRPFPPGQHGNKRKPQLTGYGLQLLEKQKAKAIYGLMERQFSNYVEKATSSRGNTSESLLKLLEMRLDNAVYRAGLAKTRRAARQAVSHGHFLVNGARVNIPSFIVRINDVIAVKPKIAASPLYATLAPILENAAHPSWLAVNAKELSARVLSAPEGAELKPNFDVTKIIEFYSR